MKGIDMAEEYFEDEFEDEYQEDEYDDYDEAYEKTLMLSAQSRLSKQHWVWMLSQ